MNKTEERKRILIVSPSLHGSRKRPSRLSVWKKVVGSVPKKEAELWLKEVKKMRREW